MNISVTGLQAAAARVNTVAKNVANQRSDAPPPATPSDYAGYKPQRVHQEPLRDGGVRAESRDVAPAYVEAYDPNSPSANADGLVARPNVELEREMVELTQARHDFAANLAVARTNNDMLGILLDVRA